MLAILSHKPLEPTSGQCRLNHDVLNTKIKELGFTNAAIAEALDISEEYIRRLRKRNSIIKIDLLDKILKFFNLSYSEVIVYCKEKETS